MQSFQIRRKNVKQKNLRMSRELTPKVITDAYMVITT